MISSIIIKVCIYKPIFTEKYVHKTPFETYNKALSSLIIIICEMLDPMYIHTATGTACLNNRLVQEGKNLPSIYLQEHHFWIFT